MNNILALSKILIKNIINSIYKNNELNTKTLGIAALIALSFIPLISNLVRFLIVAYDTLAPIQQGGVLLSFGIVTSGLIIFFLGLFYIIGTFYFSNDIESLLPLPLKPYEIISAKFLVVLIYEYLTALIVLTPILAVYGLKSGAGAIYYLFSLITFILLPVVPLAIGAIIIMLIMRFSNIGKNKDLFRYAGGIFALIVGIGINIVFQRFAIKNLADPEALQRFLAEGNNSLANVYTSIFPGLNFASRGLINSSTTRGILDFSIFVIIVILLFAVFLYAAERLYFKGVLGISETSSKKRELSTKEFRKNTRKSNVIFTYTLKELRILFRTPIYFLNCVLMSFIFPVLFLIPTLTQEGGISTFRNISKALQADSTGIVLAGGFAFAMFLASVNAVTATSISREGHNYYVGKYIPISYEVQIAAKVLSGMVIAIIGTITMLLAAMAVIALNPLIAILILIVSIFGIAFSAMIGIAIDLYNPKLTWDSEQKAVKQNMNVIFHLIIGVLLAGLTILMVTTARTGLSVTFIGIIISYGVFNLIIYKFLKSKGAKLYNEISE